LENLKGVEKGVILSKGIGEERGKRGTVPG